MNARTEAAFDAVAALDRPEIWIQLRTSDAVASEADAATGPLAGLLLAVKNNVDVAGHPTTAGCPGFAQAPATDDAPAVARLRDGGATVMGTTNLDQFATGLVGQRSPHGGVRDARDPNRVSGGSSAGSAVAVALGLADIAIGTDTAGSGRVPAALQGIVGIKPTPGVVSTLGVVPACRSWDAVTIFARDLGTANAAMAAMAGGARTRPWPTDTPLAAPAVAHVAVPDLLPGLSTEWVEAFDAAVARVRERGHQIRRVPFAPFLEAARLLYDGALVAERHAAVGAFVDAHLDDVDPIVGGIIHRAGTVRASDLVADQERLERLRRTCVDALDGCHALLVPTAPGHPTRAEVDADPVGVNSWMGTYTNFCNLFDLCAVAVPSGEVDDSPFGVSVIGRPFHDAVALDLAGQVALAVTPVAASGAAPERDCGEPWPVAAGADVVELFVVGAHLPGQPLARELEALGARWAGPARTSPRYRLVALGTEPAKPGLIRCGSGGASVEGGCWQLGVGALGGFLASLPAPMTLGTVDLQDGREVVGFGCTAEAAAAGTDITEFGGWLRYLESRTSVG